MMKKLGITLLFFALGSVTALAADFNGKWTADVPGRNGNTQTLTFDFHVDGTTLTGTVTTRTFSGGGDRPPQEFVAKRATDAAPTPAPAPAAPPQ